MSLKFSGNHIFKSLKKKSLPISFVMLGISGEHQCGNMVCKVSVSVFFVPKKWKQLRIMYFTVKVQRKSNRRLEALERED